LHGEVEVVADELRIHSASIAEVEVLYAILVECGLDVRDRLGLTHWAPAYPRHLFEEQVAKGEVFSVETAANGETVATFAASDQAPRYLDLSLWVSDGEPCLYLARLTVLPRLQRRGIGQACIATAERLALERGRRSVRLDAAEQHAELVRWYLKLGYREVCRYDAFGNRMVGFEKLVPGHSVATD
jgi:GNAT superfamily N-acetyltransferase